jgi:hypothetical protein
MKIHCWENWIHGCHYAPCEAVAYGHGAEKCETRLHEMHFLDMLLQGSSAKRKPGKSMYISKTRGWKSPRARIVKP